VSDVTRRQPGGPSPKNQGDTHRDERDGGDGQSDVDRLVELSSQLRRIRSGARERRRGSSTLTFA